MAIRPRCEACDWRDCPNKADPCAFMILISKKEMAAHACDKKTL